MSHTPQSQAPQSQATFPEPSPIAQSASFKDRALNVALLLVIAFIWASAFGAMKIAVQETGALTLAATRSSIAAAILLIILRIKGPIDWQIGVRHFPKFLVVGGLGSALPFAMIPWAEYYVESSLAGLLMSVGPLATLAGAFAFGLEKEIPKRRIFGLVIGLCGAVLIFSDGLRMAGSANLTAQIVIVLASLCYVCGNLMVRRLSFIPPLTISALAISLSSLLLWPAALIFETPAFGTWSVLAWQMVLWLGVMSTAFAFSIRYFLIARAGASFTSYVGYLIPAFAVMIGAIWLGESVTIEKLSALCLILVGLVFAQKPASGQKNQS